MPGLQYKLRCVEMFLDGNVYPRRVNKGEVITVDEMTKKKMDQSAPGAFEVLGKAVPPPTKSKNE